PEAGRRVLVVRRPPLRIRFEPRRVERVLLEEPHELRRARPTLDELADDWRDNRVIKRIELSLREFCGGSDGERVFGNHLAPVLAVHEAPEVVDVDLREIPDQ